jgi:F-type H+-transporting ATPase subunit alpha
VYLEPNLFNAGVRPAINVGLSVSRVGGAAQIKAMKQVAGTMRLDLAQYRELAAFAQFGSDLDKFTRDALIRGERMTELLKQEQYAPMDAADQAMVIFAGGEGYADDVAVEEMARFEKELLAYLHENLPGVFTAIHTGKKLPEEKLKELREAIEAFKRTF